MTLKNWKSLLSKLSKVFLLFFFFSSQAYEGKKNLLASEPPHNLKSVKVNEKLGQSLDLNLKFRDVQGKEVSLKKFFKKPVLMTVVYYRCPNICNFHLQGLFSVVQKIPEVAGKDYSFVVVSMDSKETPLLAQEKKESYLKEFSRKGQNVAFLTGSKKNIEALTKNLGFSFYWDNETKQFAHTPVAYFLSPQGKITRYLYGVEFEKPTFKLSLVEASAGKIGNVIDRILLFCYRFNPKQSRYVFYAYNVMRAGAGLVVVLLLLFLTPLWWREKRKSV